MPVPKPQSPESAANSVGANDEMRNASDYGVDPEIKARFDKAFARAAKERKRSPEMKAVPRPGASNEKLKAVPAPETAPKLSESEEVAQAREALLTDLEEITDGTEGLVAEATPMHRFTEALDVARERAEATEDPLLLEALKISPEYYDKSEAFIEHYEARKGLGKLFSRDKKRYKDMKAYVENADKIIALIDDQYIRGASGAKRSVTAENAATKPSGYSVDTNLAPSAPTGTGREIAGKIREAGKGMSAETEAEAKATQAWLERFEALKNAREDRADMVPESIGAAFDAIDTADYLANLGAVESYEAQPKAQRPLEGLPAYLTAKRRVDRVNAIIKNLETALPLESVPGAKGVNDLEKDFFGEGNTLQEKDLFEDTDDASEEVESDAPISFATPEKAEVREEKNLKSDTNFFMDAEKLLEAIEDETDEAKRQVMADRLRLQLNRYTGQETGVRDEYLEEVNALVPVEDEAAVADISEENRENTSEDREFFLAVDDLIERARNGKTAEIRGHYFNIVRARLDQYRGDNKAFAETLKDQVDALESAEEKERENLAFFDTMEDLFIALQDQKMKPEARQKTLDWAQDKLDAYTGDKDNQLYKDYQALVKDLSRRNATVTLDNAANMVPEEVEAAGVADVEDEDPDLEVELPPMEDEDEDLDDLIAAEKVERADVDSEDMDADEYKEGISQELLVMREDIVDNSKRSVEEKAKAVHEALDELQDNLDEGLMNLQDFNEMVGAWLQDLRESGEGALVNAVIEMVEAADNAA